MWSTNFIQNFFYARLWQLCTLSILYSHLPHLSLLLSAKWLSPARKLCAFSTNFELKVFLIISCKSYLRHSLCLLKILKCSKWLCSGHTFITTSYSLVFQWSHSPTLHKTCSRHVVPFAQCISKCNAICSELTGLSKSHSSASLVVNHMTIFTPHSYFISLSLFSCPTVHVQVTEKTQRYKFSCFHSRYFSMTVFFWNVCTNFLPYTV
jgi:hypothetical protein